MDNNNLLNKIKKSEFDVFLCHNSLDKDEVKKIGWKLIELGILPWLDEWNLRPGFPWQKELENQIASIKSVAVFVGDNNIGPWQDHEIDAFLRQFTKKKCPVIPVILPSCNQVPTLPIFLEGFTWVDFRINDPNPLGQLIWGITGERNFSFHNYSTVSENGFSAKDKEQIPTSVITNIYGSVYGQVHTGSGNIVFTESKSAVDKLEENIHRSSIGNNYHQEQLGQEYEKKLTDLNNQRIIGDIDGAWDNLRNILEDLTVRDIPQIVAARYYYQAALWAITDYPDKEDAERYYSHALSLNGELDTRIYIAKKLLGNGNFEDALETLKPYDKENILSVALQVLIEQRKGSEAKNLLSQSNIKITHRLRHMLSLCYIQSKEYDSAKVEIQKAIDEVPNAPVYQLIAGLIEYWRGVPDDIGSIRDIYPGFINIKLFTPTDEKRRHLEEALLHFEKAKVYASFYNNKEIINEINQFWYLTAYLLPEKREDANKLVISIIKDNPVDSVAVIYAIENGLSLDESVFYSLKELIDKRNYNLNHIIALASFYLQKGEGNEAQELLNQFKDEFLRHKAFETWILMMIDAYSCTNDLDKAEKLIDSVDNLDAEYKDRLRCSIYEKLGRNNEVKDLLVTLSEKTGTRIDMRNLILFYKKEKLWGAVIESAKEWLEKYSDVQAVEILADAQLRDNRPNECLDTLSKYKMLFPDCVLPISAKMIQLNAYQALGRLDDALNNANELWKQTPDENLLLLRARLYFFVGDKDSSISVLRNGVSEGYSSAGIFIMLADLIKHERPNEAFEYANKAIEVIYDNPQVYLSAISIGFHTGHDFEAHQLLVEFQSKFPNSELLRSIPTTEMIPFMQKWAEDANQKGQYYLDGQVPLHFLLDYQNSPMGLDFYWKWNHNKNVDFMSKVPFLLSFGGRGETDFSMFKSDIIYMDYSACLVAHALELFESLKNGFSQIVVSPFLLGYINMEIHNTIEVQISRIETRKKLLSNINKLKIKYIPIPYVSNTGEFDVELSDFKEFIAAKENNALIVSDSFSTEMLRGRSVPNEFKSLQVYVHEVLQALVKMGELEVSTVEQLVNKRGIRDDVVDILIKSTTSLLVDSVFINTMQDLDCLDIVAERFCLVAFEGVFDYFINEQKALENREEAANWLKRLLDILNDLKTEHKLIMGSAIQSEIENDKMKISGLLTDMLSYGKENEIVIWCDDRNINSYSSCGKASIVGVFDIIEWLHEHNNINQDTYRAKMNALYSSGVQFHVPSSKYLTMILGLTNVDESSGLLKETSRVRIIRQYISAALSEHTTISKQKLNHVYLPEIGGFMLSLHKLFENTLFAVWSEPNRDEDWRAAASTWLILYCSDFIGDVTQISGNNDHIDEFTATKQSLLISLGFRMTTSNLVNSRALRGYFNWLFSWLEKYWKYNQDIKRKTLDHFMQLLTNTIKKDINLIASEDKRIAFIYIFRLFMEALPENARQWIINHREVIDILGDVYKKVIIVEGLPKSIQKDTWYRWVSNALDRGSMQKGVEFLEGEKINITYQEGTVTSQYIQVGWKNKDGKKYLVNLLEPYAQLYHPNAQVRCSWIVMASQYLGANIDIKDIKDDLRDPNRFHDAIDRLESIFLKSPRYFYEQLRIEIKNDTSKLPVAEMLFPHDPEIFINQLSTIPNPNDINGKLWVDYCNERMQKSGLDETLSILSTLPLGEIYSFSNLLNKLIEIGVLKVENVIDWCIVSLEDTFNPIKQQNIIAYLMQHQQLLSQTQIELIAANFIMLFESNIEKNKDAVNYHKLYILLLKTSWRYMESIEAYNNFSVEMKILWVYIYADIVLQIYLELINQNRLPYSVEAVCEAFKNVARHLFSDMHPLRLGVGFPLEVTHPENSSVWRNIYGGTLAIIQDNNDIVEPINNVLKPILTRMEEKCFSQDVYFIDGGDEYLLSFNNTNNYFFSNFKENNIKRIQTIRQNWGDEISEKYNPIDLCKIILDILLKRGTFDDYALSHLIILAKQPFPQDLLDLIKCVIEKYRISNDLAEKDLMARGRMLSIIIKGFQGQELDYYRSIYKQDLEAILLSTPSRWKEAIEILLNLYSSYDYISASEDFITALEEIVMNQQIEISPEFVNFINSMPWWMPTKFLERIHKFRRWVNSK